MSVRFPWMLASASVASVASVAIGSVAPAYGIPSGVIVIALVEGI